MFSQSRIRIICTFLAVLACATSLPQLPRKHQLNETPAWSGGATRDLACSSTGVCMPFRPEPGTGPED